MPSHKRKDPSDDEDDAPASLQPSRRSLSPAPSPKRRRCDPLERAAAAPAATSPAAYPPFAPTIQLPTTPNPTTTPAAPLWAEGPHIPNVTHLPNAGASAVVLPGSVEEPTSPQTVMEEEADAPEVKMKVRSWYELEKDRTSSPSHASSSASFTAYRRPPRPTVTDASSSSSSSARSSASSSRSGSAGIVITDLDGSDSEDEEDDGSKVKSSADADAPPEFTISSALLDRLPKPVQTFGPLAPEANPGNALVLYRPLPLPSEARVEESEDEEKENRGARAPQMAEDDAPRIEEVVEDVPIAEEEMPVDDQIEFTPIVDGAGEPMDEPMDVEML
ncbi:hypothetical protein BN946_scf184796.g3 [Trametes cinnabarina]|uniref:Uncharacterized protein n=1 Tax=Pycnoporus cinnabarinus TaxID=5643 RepID=A0A060SWV5_PYCCI|nr:hypothetical protein BN946_scf184796.g3 [Trametes cinnabarina]